MTYNLKFCSHVKKSKKIDQINFNNIFHLAQYIPDIISMTNQYKDINETFYFIFSYCL